MRTAVATRVLKLRRAAERSWNLFWLGRERDHVAGSIVHDSPFDLRSVALLMSSSDCYAAE
jgi:hypothetical protein